MEKGQLEILETQKKFLHDIASPICIVQGMVEIVLTELKANDKIDPKIVSRLEKVLVASIKIDSLLKANREYLGGLPLGVL